jgi:predicted TIM-barrel fold metal-dependent hydrolase
MNQPRPVPLVDVHSHFLTSDYVEAARTAGHGRPDGNPGWPTWDAARHLELMDEWGVGISLLSVSSPGTHFGDDAAARYLTRQVNDAGAEVRRAHPDRFGHFASLPLPDVDGALAELEYAMDQLGCDGATLETNTAGVYLGDPRYETLLAELDRRRTPVFVHPTSPPNAAAVSLGRPTPMLEFLFDTTRTVSDLAFAGSLQRHPEIPWIFTHGGGALPLLTERMELFRQLFGAGDVDPRVAATIPEQVGRLWFDMAGTPFPHQVPAVAAAFGTDRLLYGSDYCWTPAAGVVAQLASVESAPQPEGDTWRGLTTRNAVRLFPRLAPTAACEPPVEPSDGRVSTKRRSPGRPPGAHSDD